MTITDHVQLSLSNLWRMKLRSALTIVGVTVGVGALVSMLSFGFGMQRNITESFNSLELFNSITVLPETPGLRAAEPDARRRPSDAAKTPAKAIDDAAIAAISKLPGVEIAFADVRFPAKVAFNGEEDFRLVQVLPARVSSSPLVHLVAGTPFRSDDDAGLIVSRGFLRDFKITDPAAAIGKSIEISSVALAPSAMSPLNWPALLQGGGVSFERHSFAIRAVTGGTGMGAPSPILSDLYIASGTASKVGRLPFTSVWDLFRLGQGTRGASALNVRLSSPAYVESVKAAVRRMGFTSIAMADQFAEIKKTFLYMDMFLMAVAMIAIVVASLGIINTMVMSILERYAEIGVMKAVGASDADISKIFFVESSVIGFLGGLSGLLLGWGVSRLINLILNYFLARRGVPYIDYFNTTIWLALGAIAFSIAISLVAGIYPASRAARIDPVAALRHD